MLNKMTNENTELRFVGSAIIPYEVEEANGYVIVQTKKDNLWGLPGGSIDLFENPQRATIREVWEETGLHVLLDGLVGIYPFKTHRAEGDERTPNFAMGFVYLAHVVDGELGSNKDGVSRVEIASIGKIRELHYNKQLRSYVNLKSLEDHLMGQKADMNIVSHVLQG